MREIKFEFVSKHDDGKTFHKQVYTLDEIMYTLPEYVHKGHPMKPYTIIAKRQYTGLTDKNGKEIYEGDIVSHGGGKGMAVIYQPPKFVMKEKIKKGFSACWSEFTLSPDQNQFEEVIGNIYEHGELLDEK